MKGCEQVANTSKASDVIRGQMSADLKVQNHTMLNALTKGITEKIKNATGLDVGEPMGKSVNGMEITYFLNVQSPMEQEQYDRTKDAVGGLMQKLKNPTQVVSLINKNGLK